MRELLAAGQAERKAKLDAGRVNTVLLDSADIGKLRPRWDGPFTVTACPSPNAYTLTLQVRMRCSPTVNVDRLKPSIERAGSTPAPGPVSYAGNEGEHEVELLLNRLTVRVVTRYLVLWCGHASADSSSGTTSGCGWRSCGQRLDRRFPPLPPRRRRHWWHRGVSARGPGGGPDRRCPHRAGSALPLADRGLGPRHRGPPGSRTWCATAALRRSGRWRLPRFSTGPRTARQGVGCSSIVCISLAFF